MNGRNVYSGQKVNHLTDTQNLQPSEDSAEMGGGLQCFLGAEEPSEGLRMKSGFSIPSETSRKHYLY